MSKTKCALIMALILICVIAGKSAWSQSFWWQSEYKDLIKAINIAKNASLSTSYRTGPGGKSQVKLSLLKKPAGSLILKVELPKEAIPSIDPKTGEMIPSKVNPILTIRDHNLDGIPDDFNKEPSGKPLYEEEFTKDGFTKFRNSPDHQVILILWSVGIGYSINYFLHGVDSAKPRGR
jgi:hypothetical protein